MDAKKLRKVNQALVYGIRLCQAARQMIKSSGVECSDIMNIERQIREAAGDIQAEIEASKNLGKKPEERGQGRTNS